MQHRALPILAVLLVAALVSPIIPTQPAKAGYMWTDIGESLGSYEVQSMASDQTHNVLYAAIRDSSGNSRGLWRCSSPDINPKWTPIGGGKDWTSSFLSLAYDVGHNMLYASTGMSVWRCSAPDTTPAWTKISTTYFLALAFDTARDILYASGKSVWRCTTPEDSPAWTNIGGPYCAEELALDSSRNVLYAGLQPDSAMSLTARLLETNFGVYRCKSPDTSTRWAQTGRSIIYDTSSLVCDEAHNALYAGFYDLVFVNEDEGFELVGQGVWRCDNPDTAPVWTNISDGTDFGSREILALQYDAGSDLLFATAYSLWTCFTPSGSPSWVKTGGELTSSCFINHLAFDSQRNLIFAGGWDTLGHHPGLWCAPISSDLSTFYFAEGYTGPGFQEYLCIGNPNKNPAVAVVTYMFPDGKSRTSSYVVPSTGRATIDVNKEVGPDKEVSAKVTSTTANLVCERPMYFNYKGVWNGGHDIVGASFPASVFYFAEGTCRPNFDCYYCLLNPNDSAADTRITYMKGDGTTKTQDLRVNAHSRYTVECRKVLGAGDDAAHDFSAKVECTNGQKIVAERPMYFNYNGVWTGGSDVVGVTEPAYSYCFAEGTCRPGFDPYICIQNPGNREASIEINYSTNGSGTTNLQSMKVSAHSRITVSAKDFLGQGDDAAHDFSCYVVSPGAEGCRIVAERPMYFNYKPGALNWNGGFDTSGSNGSQGSNHYLAEGSCRPNYEPYICIYSASDAPEDITITYMRGDGSTVVQNLHNVAPKTRTTIAVKSILGEGDDVQHDFSTVVSCANEDYIYVERSMYFNYQGSWTGGHDVFGFTP